MTTKINGSLPDGSQYSASLDSTLAASTCTVTTLSGEVLNLNDWGLGSIANSSNLLIYANDLFAMLASPFASVITNLIAAGVLTGTWISMFGVYALTTPTNTVDTLAPYTAPTGTAATPYGFAAQADFDLTMLQIQNATVVISEIRSALLEAKLVK